MTSHKRSIQCTGLMLALVVLLFPSAAMAGQQFVLVTFDESASLAAFSTSVDPDDPALRGSGSYLDISTVGAVRYLEATIGFQAQHIYSASVRGFAARVNSRELADLQASPLVALVVADGTVEAASQEVPWGIIRVDAINSSTFAGDGQGTVDHVDVFVLDTGIDNHPDLNVTDRVSFVPGPSSKDCNGHGTHVAGTIAAKDNNIGVVGVAPGASLIAVRVLGCNGRGTWSSVLAGIDWVTAHAPRPSVVSMALIGPANPVVDSAINAAVSTDSADLFFAVAAGNDAQDACLGSPSREGANAANGIMTVAATDRLDQETEWSNFGACVDAWAPGDEILSTWKNGQYRERSGTSMAAAHAAGTAALYRSNNGSASAVEVELAIREDLELLGPSISTSIIIGPQPPADDSSKDGRDLGIVDSGGY